MLYLAPLMFALFVSLCKGNNSSLDAIETLLHNLYERVDEKEGCGTPIKCIVGADTRGNKTGPGSRIPCCYDCDSCTGPGCYRGWQCCRKDTHGTYSVPEDNNLRDYIDIPKDTMSCQQLYFYEKVISTYRPFETGVNEENLSRMIDYYLRKYWMVSSCPGAYIGDETKRLCERSTPLGLVIDHVPYLSTETSRLYKNRHCVKCHHSDITKFEELGKFNFIPFDISLQLDNWHYRYNFINTFESVLDLINFTLPLQTNMFDYKLRIRIMATAEHLRHNGSDVIMAPPCNYSIVETIDTCEQSSFEDKERLQQACQNFYLPVFVKDNLGYGSIVQNWACGLCAGSELLKLRVVGKSVRPNGRCALTVSAAPYMILNLSLALAKPAKNSNDPTEEYLDLAPPSADNNNGTRCLPGRFWDELLGGCRKILCPRRQYIVNGQCEPLYGLTVMYSFFVKIKATFSQSSGRIHAKTVYYLEDDLTSFLVDESGMELCGTNIWVKFDTKQYIDYIIFEIFLTPKDNILYNDAMRPLRVIFEDYFNDVFMSKSKFDNSTVRLEAGDLLFTNYSYPFPTAYDSYDGTTLEKATSKNGKVFFPRFCGLNLDITKQDYCYRMKLSPDEFHIETIQAMNRMKLIKTGAMIYRDKYEPLLDGNALICINDYHKQEAFVRARPTQIRTRVNLVDVKPDDSNLSAEITYTVIAASIFVGCIGIYACKRIAPKIRDTLCTI